MTEFDLLEVMVEFQPKRRELAELVAQAQKSDDQAVVLTDWKRIGTFNWRYFPNAELLGYNIFKTALAEDKAVKLETGTEDPRTKVPYNRSRAAEFAAGVFSAGYKGSPPEKKN